MVPQVLLGLRVAGVVALGMVLALGRQDIERPFVAGALLASAAAFTLWAVSAWRAGSRALGSPSVLVLELCIGAALQAGDGWVLGAPQAYEAPALGALWPLAGVMATGASAGPVWGGGAGLALGLARLGGALAPHVVRPLDLSPTPPVEARAVPVLGVVALYVLAGVGAAWVVRLSRRAQEQLSTARAREEMARALHDGVLQTLTVVQHRSEDPTVARLARDTERDLRAFLFDTAEQPRADLADALRAAARTFARRFDLTPEVVVDDDVGRLSPGTVSALAGAVGEALTNVGRHAGAGRVVVFAGPEDDGVSVSVKDDGTGFRPEATPEGHGLAHSVRQRVAEAGGRVEVRSAPGRGTEVRLWAP